MEELTTVEGMSAVFAAMSTPPDIGYHCLAPWKILPDQISGETAASKRLIERASVRETISRAMGTRHKM